MKEERGRGGNFVLKARDSEKEETGKSRCWWRFRRWGRKEVKKGRKKKESKRTERARIKVSLIKKTEKASGI